MKTDDELKQIAKDIFHGLVFTDKHVDNDKELPLVFMPICFLKEEQIKELDDVGMIYEYLSKSGRGSINDMPAFTSFRTLTIPETEKVFDFHQKLIDAEESALS